jgi:hypothetical protein
LIAGSRGAHVPETVEWIRKAAETAARAGAGPLTELSFLLCIVRGMTRARNIIMVLAGALGTTLAATSIGDAQAPAPGFSSPTTIDNPYLPVTKFRRCEFRGLQDDGTRERDVLKLLKRTRRFVVNGQGIQAVVVQDSAFEDGKLIERTLDYFAQDDAGNVHYLGEHVNDIRRGRVISHHGSWLYGKDTNVLGVAMPANPKLGDQWHLEDEPRITTESDRVEETGMRALARGRLYTDVIRTQEFTQPEGEVEYKLYAPGVGVITEYPPDGRALLHHCSR